jgi:hypothetical protein
MVNDPHAIADSMVEEHGLDRAIDIAVEETQSAHNAGAPSRCWPSACYR